MHFNMKHFVITIVSIFLALGIGIAIGATIDGQQLFIEEQGRLVEQIEKSIDKVKEENNSLVEEIDGYKSVIKDYEDYFEEKVRYEASTNPLDNRVLVIDLFSGFDKNNVKDILKDLGAQRVDEVSISNIYDSANKETLNALKEEFDLSIDSPEKLRAEMLNLLFTETEKFERVEELLRAVQYIDVKGSLESIADNYDYVVIADSNANLDDDIKNNIRNMIIDNLNGINLSFSAVQSYADEPQSMKFYKDNRVSTIDNVDQATGKLALIQLISGKTGSYGVKDYSTALMPVDTPFVEKKEEPEPATETLTEDQEGTEGVEANEGQQ